MPKRYEWRWDYGISEPALLKLPVSLPFLPGPEGPHGASAIPTWGEQYPKIILVCFPKDLVNRWFLKSPGFLPAWTCVRVILPLKKTTRTGDVFWSPPRLHILTSTQDTITGRRSQNHKDSDADDKFVIMPRFCNLWGQIKRSGFMVSDLERPSAVKERGAVFSESLTTKKKETDARFGLFLCSSWLVAQLRGESCIIIHHVLCLCAQGS